MDFDSYFNVSHGDDESPNSSKLEDNGLNIGICLDESSSSFSEARILKNVGGLSSCFEEKNRDFLNLPENKEDLTLDIQEIKKLMCGLMTEISVFNNKSDKNQNRMQELERACIKNKKKISKMKKRVRSHEEKIDEIEKRLSRSPYVKHPSSKFLKKYFNLFFHNNQNLPDFKRRTLNPADLTLSSTKSSTPLLIKKKILIK